MAKIAYRLSMVITDPPKLGVIIGALASREGISFHIEEFEQINNSSKEIVTAKKSSTQFNPEKSQVVKVLFKAFEIGQEFTRKEGVKVLTDSGWSGSSFSPSMSRLVKAGYIEIVDAHNGIYKRLKKSLETL